MSETRISNEWSRCSPRTLAIIATATGALAFTTPSSAQVASAIDFSSRSGQPSGNAWQSQLAVSPFARFDRPRLALAGRWTALGVVGQRLDGYGHLGATYYSPTLGGLQLSAAAFGDRDLLNESFAVSQVGADARLSYRSGSAGAWLGREVARDNKSTPISPFPHYSAGAWRQLGSAVMTLSVSSYGSIDGARPASVHQEVVPWSRNDPLPNAPDSGSRVNVAVRTLDTITVVDSGNAGKRRNWRDAELGLHWSTGRLALQAVVGTRFSVTNVPNDTWGQMQGSWSLTPDLALIAAGGVQPSSAAYGLPRARFAQLGVRVAPSALVRPRLPAGVRPVAAGFEIENADHGKHLLRIRIPGARVVELSGDFTNWTPIALKHGDADTWEATLAIAPGMHRLAIRVNGEAWTPPPGIAAVPDEFQGTVGVIVVR